MDLLENISGTYYSSEIDEKTGFGNEFLLKIAKTEQGKYEFFFEMATIGAFGKMGETWKGYGYPRGDHIALIINEQINWVEDNISNQRTESNETLHNPLPIELFPHQDTVAIFHKKLDKLIKLKRLEDVETK